MVVSIDLGEKIDPFPKRGFILQVEIVIYRIGNCLIIYESAYLPSIEKALYFRLMDASNCSTYVFISPGV